MHQSETLDLFEPQKKPISQGFEEFHAAHPEVYVELVKLATKAKVKGRRKWGVKALFEVLRWQREFSDLPSDAEDYKLNNNYTALYARLIMEKEPFLATYFETRERGQN